MIQLFEENKIEVLSNSEGVFFKVQNVFKSLGLTWRNIPTSLNSRGILNDDLRKGIKLVPIGSNEEPHNAPVYISEIAMYQLAFRSNKPKAQEFTRWCANVIKTIRQTGKYEINSNGIEFKKHISTDVQKQHSKDINTKLLTEKGKEGMIEYNRKNCKLHTGKTPSELKEIGKGLGLKSKQRSSGKEVVRNIKPELGAAMSFTDGLVLDDNLEHEKAAGISLELAQPLFKALMDAGMSSKDIEKLAR